MALSLQARGNKVEIVTFGQHDEGEEGGLAVHRLPSFRLPMAGFFKHYHLCAWNPANWWRLNQIAKNCDAEAIILVNHYLDIALPTRLASFMRKVPLVCSVGTQLQSLNPRRNRVLNILDYLICGFMVFPGCKRIIAWDTQIQQYLIDVHGNNILNKISIVNYGVHGDSSRLLAHQHDYTPGDIILGVGAVSEQRSFVPLVKAFAHIAKDRPKLRLQIIGHVYFDKAPKLIKKLGLEDRIEFLGEQSHDQVLAQMGKASLLYSSLTGKYVGLGTATIEAMLMALPTVANVPLDLLGSEQIIDRHHLVQCCSEEPKDIAEHIEILLDDKDLRQRVGEGERAFVQENLNWQAVAHKMEEVLEQSIKDNQ